MQRKTFLRNTGLALAGVTLINQKIAATFFNVPEWKIKMLTKHIGVFTEKGGTILFYIAKKDIVVVDAQFPDTAQHLIDEVKKKSNNPFALLINTHHHYDHTSGNIAFKGLVKDVVAHANSLANQKTVATKNNTEDKQLYPNITFTDLWTQTFGNENIGLHYFGAAHTNGDIVVHLPHANIVHLGDLMFNRKHPYVDKSAGANMEHWIKVLDKINSSFDNKTTFVCGHAGDGFDILPNKDDLKKFGDYLGSVLQFVNGEIKGGKSKAEILKNSSFPGMDTWNGEGISRPLEAAYIEIQAKLT